MRERKGLKFVIQVDGGINVGTIDLAVAAGAEVIVAGSAVFREGRVHHNLAALRHAVVSARRVT
jgi:ribulose-phosphate 3-epimerase